MVNTLEAAKQALAEQRFFDGVQNINAAMEAWEENFMSVHSANEAWERCDILRKPEDWLKQWGPKLDPAHRPELASIYALRARLLAGLGAQKRAVLDISAALLVTPYDTALVEVKKGIEDQVSGDPAQPGGKVPTTIITGFLGAGKTTLLNHILEANHGKRIAVIENEFGEIGIDDKLLSTSSATTEENIIEMNNGCICCTVRDDLIVGLKKLHKQTAGKGKPLDGIVIETTGLANPAPVAQTFFADEFVRENMSLDGILTVVDAKHVLRHLREQKPEGVVNESVEQVAFADRILLNKTDLVSREELAEVRDEIRSINKSVNIRNTQNAKTDMDFLLGIKAFSLDKVLDQVNDGFLEEEEDDHDHEDGDDHGHSHGDGGHAGHGEHGHEEGHGHGHNEGHGGHEEGHGHGHDQCHEGHGADDGHKEGNGGHGSGHGQGHGSQEGGRGHHHSARPLQKKKRHVHDYTVTSVGIERDAEIIGEKLSDFINWLLKEKGSDLYRSKGVLAVQGMKDKFVFHAVQMQFDAKPQNPWLDGEKRCCKMIFIGKNLNREELNTRFDECLVK